MIGVVELVSGITSDILAWYLPLLGSRTRRMTMKDVNEWMTQYLKSLAREARINCNEFLREFSVVVGQA